MPSKARPTAKQVEMWPLERLTPYRGNARTHSRSQVRQIAASIEEFGFTNPILVDADGGILAGHGRFAAATDMGMTHVPVVVLDHLTPEQRKAYVIADNQLALNAGWDMDVLREEVVGLQLQDFNLDLLGFDDDALAGMLGGGEFEGIEDDPVADDDDPIDRGVALPIVLSPEEMAQWRQAKAELGYSTDKAAFWKLVTDLLEEVAA